MSVTALIAALNWWWVRKKVEAYVAG